MDRVADQHRGEQGLVRADVVIRPEHALAAEGEDHIVGGHLVAVVELYALAEGELDGALVEALPALGHPRHRFELAQQVLHDQRLEQEGEDSLADIGLLAQRLQRSAVGDLLHGDRDGRPLVGLADGDPGQADARGNKARGGDQATATQEHDANSLDEEATLVGVDERAVTAS